METKMRNHVYIILPWAVVSAIALVGITQPQPRDVLLEIQELRSSELSEVHRLHDMVDTITLQLELQRGRILELEQGATAPDN